MENYNYILSEEHRVNFEKLGFPFEYTRFNSYNALIFLSEYYDMTISIIPNEINLGYFDYNLICNIYNENNSSISYEYTTYDLAVQGALLKASSDLIEFGLHHLIGQRVSIVKEESLLNHPHPNGIEAGYSINGILGNFKIEYSLWLSSGFRTSPIKKIISINTDTYLVHTKNSIYHVNKR